MQGIEAEIRDNFGAHETGKGKNTCRNDQQKVFQEEVTFSVEGCRHSVLPRLLFPTTPGILFKNTKNTRPGQREIFLAFLFVPVLCLLCISVLKISLSLGFQTQALDLFFHYRNGANLTAFFHSQPVNPFWHVTG